MKNPFKKVCVIGLWHLGSVTAAALAESGYSVIGLANDSKTAESLNRGIPPLFEPGLEALFKKHLKGRKLLFTDSAKEAVRNANPVIIAFDSPLTEQDQVDTSPVFNAVRTFSPFLDPETTVIIHTQLPVGTSEQVEKSISKYNKSWKGAVVYSLENLKLGQSIELYLKPDMIVLGSNHPAHLKLAKKFFQPMKAPKITTNLKTAEMVKQVLNNYLATMISFANQIGMIADQEGVDAMAIGKILRYDRRVGRKAPLSPGLGFSGWSLIRDLKSMQQLAKKHHVEDALLCGVEKINESTFDWVMKMIRSSVKNLRKASIGFLGLTYKPGTSSMRRSPAIKIFQELTSAGAQCRGYDPKADRVELRHYPGLKVLETPEKMAQNCDCILLLTEWPEFRMINFSHLKTAVKKPILIDTKNFLEKEVIAKAGFHYQGFGRGGNHA